MSPLSSAVILYGVGDRFYIRTHMNYEAPKGSNHMSFKPGEIFLVNDTLRAGVIGKQQAARGNTTHHVRSNCAACSKLSILHTFLYAQ